MGTEIDAADVLSSYSSVLMNAGDGIVRDINELPYSKEIIKTVLFHCINLTAPAGEREFLRKAYVALADFQPLSDAEARSLGCWKRVEQIDSKHLTDDELLNLAKGLSEGGKPGLGVCERISAEAVVLTEELQSAGL